MKEYKVVGVMSGSSLDGLDACLCHFTSQKNRSFRIIKSTTLDLPEKLKTRLRNSADLSGIDLHLLDIDYGLWIGQQLKDWLHEEKDILCIGIHGHTVFHEPQKKLSLQIGNGQIISHLTHIPVVDHFRLKDILNGGQGAPLVPMGDLNLFPQYDGWLNLGGIANITVKKDQKLLAWDIAPCNQVLNALTQKIDIPFDAGGALAESGTLIQSWYDTLSQQSYFGEPPPKSLSNQWVQNHILSDLPQSTVDGLNTYCHFLASRVFIDIEAFLEKGATVLATGGGAKNIFFIQLLQKKLGKNYRLIVPEAEIIDYKEAIIFGYLGLLRSLNTENILGKATGATKDSIGGNIHFP